jgi:hypothetical protein
MELWALQSIAEGTASLAELEKKHPILGRNLKNFVATVDRCCRDAYERVAASLDDVLTLPSIPSDKSEGGCPSEAARCVQQRMVA